MRGLVLMTLGVFLSHATLATAGLYNTSEPEEGKLSRDNFTLIFRDTLLRLRTISMRQVPKDNDLRKRYLLAAALAARVNPANLTSEQKLNLSAVLVRIGRADEAVELLKPLARQEPKNFLVLSNLATAYQLGGQVSGQDNRAMDTLEEALSVWPDQLGKVDEPFRTFLQSMGWHEKAFEAYRKAETYQLKLLKLRAREGMGKKGKSDFESVDALFDDGRKPPNPVHFVGENGKFEPGQLARDEKTKLPKDAIDIVQHLLVWLPGDDRLYWLLGELYNAQGGPKNIRAARMIFDELAGFEGRNVRPQELAEHRKALLDYHDPDSDEAGSFATLEKRVDEQEKKRQDQAPRIDWQTLGVGFATGLVVAIFGMWQLREVRRRRQNRVPR